MTPQVRSGATQARLIMTAAAFALSALLAVAPAEADIVRGVKSIVAGVLTVPLSTLAGTFQGPPVIGTLQGAAQGLINGIGLVTHGTLDLLGSGFSLAKQVAPFVLPFLL